MLNLYRKKLNTATIILILPFLFLCLALPAQNTIGLISYKPAKAYPGYNLIYPHNQPNAYLVDNCGQIVHTWEDSTDYRPGNTAYILENGNLVKTKRYFSPLNDSIWAGGGGAIVEVRDWNNQLLHSFERNDSLYRLHHDIAPMPNGNVLMIAWEYRSYEESVEAGRDTSLLPQKKLWSEVVWEWDPVLDSIVWEWKVWDHLIQDYDARKTNYGVVADHPELIDINYDEHDGHPDWLHINAIDYNPVLDQIVLSVPYFNEAWVIDHSTTLEEASGHSGGNSGKGGDLLFRWGNPLAYEKGDSSYKKNFFQHDVHWIDPLAEKTAPGFAKIALFNNRVGENLSTANILNSGFDPDMNAYPFDGTVFGPADFERTVAHPTGDVRSYSTGLSSVQILPNDNILICSGRWGYSYELTPDNEMVWEYITPIKQGQIASQGDTLKQVNNLTFRLKRYAEDYAGFSSRNLSPQGYLELNPNTEFCMISSNEEYSFEQASDVRIFPNPVQDILFIERDQLNKSTAFLYDLTGRLLKSIDLYGNRSQVYLGDFAPGLYVIKVENVVKKIVVTN